MRVLFQVLVFSFIFAAFSGCTDTKTWSLNYQVANGSPSPELVLVFRLDGETDGVLTANFNTESEGINFQPDTLKDLLAQCSNELESNAVSRVQCVDLGDHLGRILFDGDPKLFDPDTPANNLFGEIKVAPTTTEFYAVFIYGVTGGTDAERCFVMKRAVRQASSGFTISGQGTGTSLEIILERGDVSVDNDARNCFEVPLL